MRYFVDSVLASLIERERERGGISVYAKHTTQSNPLFPIQHIYTARIPI
jgi:hypothetical protein